jgi:DNA-binding NarL/FixJ family response regulator
MIEEHPPIKVLVVDDHVMVRDSIRLALSCDPAIRVVGEACDGSGLAAALHSSGAAIVLLDLRMPGKDGLAALDELHSERPDAKVIVLTVLTDEACVREAFNLGAAGYAVKAQGEEHLTDIVCSVAAGATYIHPKVRPLLMKELTHAGTESVTDPTEREVLRLVSQDLDDHEIADRLGVSAVRAADLAASALAKLRFTEPAQQVAAQARAPWSG